MSLPLLAARPLARRSALQIGRRLESTAAGKAASTAKEATSKASEYAGKAQQGLSRVTSSAGPAIANAAKGVSGALSKVGGRTGKLIAFVERTSRPLYSGTILLVGPVNRG